MIVRWNLMTPQVNEWNLLYSQNTKIELQAKVLRRWPITILFTNWPNAKVAVDKEWKKARDNSSMGSGKSQEQEGGSYRSTERYYSARNQFERFRGFLELIRRFEFELRRRENYFFWRIRFFGVFMWMCRGLFVPTQFHFECCGVLDGSW